VTIDEARAVVFAAIRAVSGRLDDYHSAEAVADLKLSDLALDSMAMIEICMEVEERTGVEFDLADLKRGTTFNGFCQLLVSRSAATGRPPMSDKAGAA
jgi:acyl carrier protein